MVVDVKNGGSHSRGEDDLSIDDQELLYTQEGGRRRKTRQKTRRLHGWRENQRNALCSGRLLEPTRRFLHRSLSTLRALVVDQCERRPRRNHSSFRGSDDRWRRQRRNRFPLLLLQVPGVGHEEDDGGIHVVGMDDDFGLITTSSTMTASGTIRCGA